MTNERIYYADAYCTQFEARVVHRLTYAGRPAVRLDRSAFYPTGGGQPHDTGTLNGVAVLDVVASDEGDPLHVLVDELPSDTVHGEVDWQRRFDHMQQHTGQHLLSAACEQLLDADTVGFHLGSESVTVDLNRARLAPEQIEPVETLVNRVVWENRPVRTRFAAREELASLSLRRQPAVSGPIRIVEVADFDANPCGGTHVRQTGEIGLLKVIRLDYRGAETRVEFVCGGRALDDYRAKHAIVTRLAGLLTVGHPELVAAVERQQGEARALQTRLRAAEEQLLELEAAHLLRLAREAGGQRAVCQVLEGQDANALRLLAARLVREPGTLALLAGMSERVALCFACADDVALDVSVWLREACAALGGKGGGRPNFAQGSAPLAPPQQVQGVLQAACTRWESTESR